MVALFSREISSGTMCPPPSLRSGSTHKTPHRGVLFAQDDTRGWYGGGTLCLLPSPSATPPPLPKGEQRENATVRRFLEAKSSPQGAEGRGYAPTRGDHVAGQGGQYHRFRYSTFAIVSSRGRVYVASLREGGGPLAVEGECGSRGAKMQRRSGFYIRRLPLPQCGPPPSRRGARVATSFATRPLLS